MAKGNTGKATKTVKDALIWSSLGGNNDTNIGGNSHAYSVCYDGPDGKVRNDTVLVDIGTMFAERSDESTIDGYMPDIDDYIPQHRWDFGTPEKPKARAILITHGHMDHIGGVVHAANIYGEKLPPIYCTPLTGSLIRGALVNANVPKDKWPRIRNIQPGRELKFGELTVEPVSVGHSISQACGFLFKAKGAKVFHTGDIKIDQTLPVGPPTDVARLKKMGSEGIDALVMDSTRAASPGYTIAEKKVGEEIEKILNENKDRRAVISTMASSLERIASISAAAKNTGRTVVLEGGALVKMMRSVKMTAGEDLYDKVTNGVTFLDARSPEGTKALEGDPSKVMVLCTGTQGEELAALPRASRGQHQRLKLDGNNDVVIMAASVIPGNEAPCDAVFNAIRGMGVPLITPKDRPTHASGHGSQDDLRDLIELVNPKRVIPVHGTEALLKAHADHIRALGRKAVETGNRSILAVSSQKGIAEIGKSKDKWTEIHAKEIKDGKFFRKEYSYKPLDKQRTALKDKPAKIDRRRPVEIKPAF